MYHSKKLIFKTSCWSKLVKARKRNAIVNRFT